MAASGVIAGNLFAGARASGAEEAFDPLFTSADIRIERIVSESHASPPGFWFDQDWDEWVVLLSGAAGLRIDGETSVRTLSPGDHLLIPAHVRHRVEWTAPSGQTIWLAVHCRPA